MVASPATIPVAMPITVGFPVFTHSTAIQVRAPTAALMCVTKIAMAALESAATALPPLNPNQPTHSMAAPITTIGLLCGTKLDPGNPFLSPMTLATTSAPTPQVA